MQAERLKILLEFLEQEPNDPFNSYAVAMEYLNKDTKKALFYLENLAENFPDYLATYYHLAAIYVAYEENEKATKTYEKGIEIATKQHNLKALRELRGSYQQFLDEI